MAVGFVGADVPLQGLGLCACLLLDVIEAKWFNHNDLFYGYNVVALEYVKEVAAKL